MPNLLTERKILVWLFESMLALALAFIFYPYVTYALDGIYETGHTALYFQILIACAALLAVIHRYKTLYFVKSPFFIWTCFYFAMSLISIYRVKSGLTPEGFADLEQYDILVQYFQQLVMFPVVVFIILCIGMNRVLILFKYTLVLVSLSVIIDFFFPWVFEATKTIETFNRAAGPYGNANAGAEACLFCLIVLRHRLHGIRMLLAYLLVGVAVFLTFSRAGQLVWLLLGVYLIWNRQISRLTALVPLILIGLLSTNFVLDEIEYGLSQIYRDNPTAVEDMMYRITYFKPKSDIEKWETTTDIEEEARTEIALQVFEKILQHPFIGWGYVYQDENYEGAQAHNIFLSLWHIYGIAGLIMWFALVVILYRSSVKRSKYFSLPVLVLVAFSFFNHNIFSTFYWFVFLAMCLLERKGAEKLGYGEKASTLGLWERARRSSAISFKKRKRKRKRRRRSKVPQASSA